MTRHQPAADDTILVLEKDLDMARNLKWLDFNLLRTNVGHTN
jgi:hypothetical protein